MSNQTLHETDLPTAKEIIHANIAQMIQTNRAPHGIMMHSAPGIGKSSIVFEAAEELQNQHPEYEFRVVDVRLGAMEFSDVQGVPYTTIADKEGEREIREMHYSTPSWFPTHSEADGKEIVYILFFDELSNADIRTQQAAYRLVLDRSINNGAELPNKTLILGAGNRKQDKTGAKGLIPALATRFGSHLYVRADLEAFLDHATEKGWHPSVISFIHYKKDAALYPSNNDAGDAFPCPRSWEFVNEHVTNPFLSTQARHMQIYGALGMSVGTDFIGHMKYEEKLPDFDKIENGDKKYIESYKMPKDVDPGFAFSIAITAAMRMSDTVDENPSAAENIAHFFSRINKELDIDMSGYVMKTVVKANKNIVSKVMTTQGQKDYPYIYATVKEVLSSAKRIRENG